MNYLFSFHSLRSLLQIFTLLQFVLSANGGAVQLNQDNVDSILAQNELVFVNFYADWCRFSQILAPIFDETAQKLSQEFLPGKVVLGKVDCDTETQVAQRYRISKYPTLKMFRHGTAMKKEYRGQRSVDSMLAFLRDELKDPITEMDAAALDTLKTDKRSLIGRFASRDSEAAIQFRRVASMLREDCQFYATFNWPNAESVAYRPPDSNQNDLIYDGDLRNNELLFAWAQDKCTPMVREITFANAEELTEEGLPFLILFHTPDDKQSLADYEREIYRQLMNERHTINFVHADGLKFTHPLSHLGKSTNDLPVLAIDSFRHMYVFPDMKQLGDPGKLRQFVDDLHSGKLHREFHHGPDPTQQGQPDQQHQDNQQPGAPDTDIPPSAKTDPPESTFNKLKPSRNRYTILRDEL